MSDDRSREAFGRFLDFLGEKGLMSPATAKTRKASSMRMMSILSDEESRDVTQIDVDDLAKRFSNLHGQEYNPGSVLAYRSRLRSALNDFQAYLNSPLSFRPSLQSRERSQKSRKENGDSSKDARSEQVPEAPRPLPPPMMTSVSVMPIPIRADLTVLIHGLPHDLTVGEAKKISAVINALAITTE